MPRKSPEERHDQAKTDALTKEMNDAFKDLNANSGEMDEYLKKSLGRLTPDQIADAAPDIGKSITDAVPDMAKANENLASPNSVHVDVNDSDQLSDISDGTFYTANTLSGLSTTYANASEELQDETEDQGDTLYDIWKALRVRGIKIDKPFLENNMKPVFKDAVYDAAGEALEDYYMLQSADKGAVTNALKKGVPLKGLGAKLGAAAQPGKNKNGTVRAAMGSDEALQKMAAAPKAPGNAAGGLVTGIGANGMAQVSPAPGEGLASVGKGERIMPAGGGGGGAQVIELRLRGDLGRIIDVRAQNVVSNHETMKTRR